MFFAVVPGASAREQMRHAAERLPVAAPGRRVPPVNYHATLAFIGEASATQIASLCEIGGALRAERCTLCFDEWAHWRTARVIVAVAGTVPSELQSLQRQLRRALEWHGWAHVSSCTASLVVRRVVRRCRVLDAFQNRCRAIRVYSSRYLATTV